MIINFTKGASSQIAISLSMVGRVDQKIKLPSHKK
jgi:hypothetical protein